MGAMVFFLIFSIILIDFLTIHKHNKKTVFVYVGIVFMVVVVLAFEHYKFLDMSPLEYIIQGMEPVVKWISEKLNTL